MSEKTPVQNPMSPTSPILCKTAGRVANHDIEFSGGNLQLSKEGGKPVQETPNPKKSLDLSEDEEIKGRPVQEPFNQENSTAGTLQYQHVEELSEGKPVQETDDPPSEKPKVGIEEQVVERQEQPIQETQGPGEGQETGTKESNQVKGGEEDREEVVEGQPRQESASSIVETECIKEEALPTQETMAAGKGPVEETGQEQEKETEEGGLVKEGKEDYEELSVRMPRQESANPNARTECTNEGEALPTQETMAAGKGPVEETGQEQETETEEGGLVKEGKEDYEELSVRMPRQESASSNARTECTNEGEALPTQETMAAGKGPFEETDQAHGTETEERSLVKEGEEDHEELSERTQLQELSETMPLQESANPNIETECTKEEALPTQEIMAAGKGPFEETDQAQGTETDERSLVKEGEGDHEELSERTQLQELSERMPLQESANPNIETECTREEALPTQETMAAGKGSFEETDQAQGTETEETGLIKEGEEDHEEICEEKKLEESTNSNLSMLCLPFMLFVLLMYIIYFYLLHFFDFYCYS